MPVSDQFVWLISRKDFLSRIVDSVIIIEKIFGSFGELLSSWELNNSKFIGNLMVG